MPTPLSALFSDADLRSMLAISSLISFFCVLFVAKPPSTCAQACKTVFACLKGAKIALGRSIPVALLGTISTIAFCSTFLGLLSWVSVVLGHDPEVYYGPHYFLRLPSAYFNVKAAVYRSPPVEPPLESRWAKRALELLHTTSTRLVVSPLVLFLVVAAPVTLLVLNIYERLEFKKSIKREVAQRVVVEEAIVEAQGMIKRRIKQLEDVEGSLECLICYERLSEPYTLAPCGHTFDIDCLVSWFRNAHPSDADQELALNLANVQPDLDLRRVVYDLARQKFCPLCHKLVVMRPAPALALCGLGIEPPEDLQANPWKAVFTEYRVERVTATGEVS